MRLPTFIRLILIVMSTNARSYWTLGYVYPNVYLPTRNSSFGMKRFVRQVLCLSGVVIVRKGKVRQVKFNPLYPLISRIALAFEALLAPYGIAVSLYEI